MRTERCLEKSGDFKVNLRKIPISTTEKITIVKDLIKIFIESEKKYKAAFLLRDLLENVYQSKKNMEWRKQLIRKNQGIS